MKMGEDQFQVNRFRLIRLHWWRELWCTIVHRKHLYVEGGWIWCGEDGRLIQGSRGCRGVRVGKD